MSSKLMSSKMPLLQAYALNGGWMSRTAEHTYVYCPQKELYFDCWGGHEGAFHRLICTGEGNPAVAECYRLDVGDYKDTAGIGHYIVDGISHQAANSFLYSARVVLNIKVLGYWASVMAYGPYGTNVLDWLMRVYKPCFKSAGLTYQMGNQLTLFQKLQLLHFRFLLAGEAVDPIQVTLQEAAIITKHFLPTVNPEVYEHLHIEFLNSKREMSESGLDQKQLIFEMNRLSRDFQLRVTDWLGAEAYYRLTGLPAGETIDLVAPISTIIE